MIEDASKVAFMLKKTEVIDLEKASEILGLHSPAKNIEQLVQKSKVEIDLGILGELSINEKTIIITTEITSALIQAYIERLDIALSIVFENNKEHYQALITKKIYLLELLDRFPSKIVQDGKDLKERLNFEFPELMETIS